MAFLLWQKKGVRLLQWFGSHAQVSIAAYFEVEVSGAGAGVEQNCRGARSKSNDALLARRERGFAKDAATCRPLLNFDRHLAFVFSCYFERTKLAAAQYKLLAWLDK
jgi:hypothetical protein